MKKHILHYPVIAWICISIGFFGCKKEETKDDTTPVVDTTPAVAFLKVGNQHKYDLKTLDPTDTTFTKYLNIDSAFIWKVESVTDGVFKVKQTVLVPFTLRFPNPDSLYIKKDKDGIWEKDSVKGTTFYLIVKSKPAVNDSIASFEIIGGKKDTTFHKVITVEESVTTDAGTFNCVKIKEWTGKTNKNIEYRFVYVDLAIGVIKMESYMYGTLLAMELKLRKKNY